MSAGGSIYAHSENGQGDWHTLTDHLRGTAELAARFAAPFGGERVAWWLGLLHDCGKAAGGWQKRLALVAGTDQPVGLDHKMLGTRLAMGQGLGSFAMAIAGHHGGLTSPEALRERLKNLTKSEQEREADALRMLINEAPLPELAAAGNVAIPEAWKQPLVREMALRLTFSSLCDADFLDTAAHFAGAARPAVRSDEDFMVLRDRFEKARAALLRERANPSAIDEDREAVYRACVTASGAKQGVFRLAAPTGVGKTISTGGFALHHAAAHGLRRVIVAVPFLTITEQNAAVYRTLLSGADGADVVLEHHSGVDLDQTSRRWARLAAENWDAPFVVTTTVRLFESLFDRRPAAMRRLHRLAGAVIVLDEVQSLPHQMLMPILGALRTLVDYFGVTVLLASATQPDFWHLSPFRELCATEIVENPVALVTRLRRVTFEWRIDPSPTLAELAEDAAGHRQALVVVNTTADARTVFDAWNSQVPDGVAWHLSTRMCAAHRRRVLTAVRKRLDAKQPVLLVSTQLIEAGVDVDFPIVYRAMAPADSLLQAAGRANREGNLATLGRVIIVDPPDAGQPSAYKTLVEATRLHFGPGRADPDCLDALRAYYQSVYGALNLEDPRSVGQRIQDARHRLDFSAVTDGPRDPVTDIPDRRYAFKMISQDGVAVVTSRGAADELERAEVEALVQRVRNAPRPEGEDLRRLQPYVTTVHPSAVRNPGALALMKPILGEPGQPGSLAEWDGGYDQHTGIELDPRTEDFVC
ncbi:CRISPR-associated helicase Cas3' [Microtetraspora fusca]|uniref:CRISPR-associated helicase Cas3 n=1 Tax=Microtetraspora fusca TaxID=1997 RepID=A0ABW6UZR2_MICFU